MMCHLRFVFRVFVEKPIKIKYNQCNGTRGFHHFTIQDFPMIMVKEQPILNPLITNNIVIDKEIPHKRKQKTK